MLGQHFERLRHAAACLGDLDHAEKQGTERLGLSCHRLFEGRAAADRELHPAQDRPQRGAAKLALQAGERLGKVDARAQVCGKLPAELRELPGADASPSRTGRSPPRRAANGPLEVLGERVNRSRFLLRSRLVAPVLSRRIRLERRVLRIRAIRPWSRPWVARGTGTSGLGWVVTVEVSTHRLVPVVLCIPGGRRRSARSAPCHATSRGRSLPIVSRPPPLVKPLDLTFV